MNEVVPDWATNPCDPNTIIHCEDVAAEWVRKAYKEEIDRLCEENKRLREENAELRNRCMTRFARIKNASNADVMARMLHKLYLSGAADYISRTRWCDLDSIEDISKFLQEVGEI